METTKRIDIEDLRKKARLLTLAIEGLYVQVKEDRMGDVEETFLPVQALAGEVDDLVQEIYSADGEPKPKEVAPPRTGREK